MQARARVAVGPLESPFGTTRRINVLPMKEKLIMTRRTNLRTLLLAGCAGLSV